MGPSPSPLDIRPHRRTQKPHATAPLSSVLTRSGGQGSSPHHPSPGSPLWADRPRVEVCQEAPGSARPGVSGDPESPGPIPATWAAGLPSACPLPGAQGPARPPLHLASGATPLGEVPDQVQGRLAGRAGMFPEWRPPVSWFRAGMFGAPWAAMTGPGSAAAPQVC